MTNEVDGECKANKILLDEEEDSKSSTNVNTFQDSLKEMGEILFKKYTEKTSVLSHENINGMVSIDVMNDYFERNFGYRYSALDTLVKQKGNRVVSHDGFGIKSITEFVKSISATFEQTELPQRMRDLYNR